MKAKEIVKIGFWSTIGIFLGKCAIAAFGEVLNRIGKEDKTEQKEQ